MSAGESSNVQHRIEMGLLLSAQMLKGEFRDQPGAMYFRWRIQAYWLGEHGEIPAEFVSAFDEVTTEMPMPRHTFYNEP